MQGGYAKRYRVKPRFYVIALLAVGVLIWALCAALGLFRPSVVEWGRLSNDQALTAIVLRDERLVPATEYSKLSCVAAEGGPVKKGDIVATLYLSGYSDKDLDTLAKLEDDIKDYQENNILKDVKNADLDAFNTKINNTMNQISAMALSGQTQGLAAAEQDLKTYMTQRMNFMPSIANADDTLNRKYQQESTLQQKIAQTCKQIASPADGIVSYYLDGFETALNVSAIDKMTPGTMKALMDKILHDKTSFTSSEYVQANQSVCRIVNASKWYAVVVLGAGENPFVQGSSFEVTFDGLQDTVNAKAVKVMTEGGTALAVLEVDSGVQQMISVRLVNGHMGRDIEGFRVPLRMIAEGSGKYFIFYQDSNGKRVRMQVTILGKDNRYAIVQETANTGELAAGLQLVRP